MPDPVTISAISSGVNMIEKMGILQAIKNKLIANPDAAAGKLAGVLSEIAKTYEAVDDVIVQFASMSFEDDDATVSAQALLEKINRGQLSLKMLDAKAQCRTIGEIYRRYLRGWFIGSQLTVAEQAECQRLFSDLADADMRWIEMLEKVANGFEMLSDQMLECLAEDDAPEADQLRREALKTIVHSQKRLGAGLQQLQALKVDFVEVSHALL